MRVVLGYKEYIMVSVFAAIIVIYSCFWMTFGWRSRYEEPEYSKAELGIFFVLARLVPGIINMQWNIGMWKNAVAELIAFGILIRYMQKTDSQKKNCVYAMYLFQPGTILAILYGSFIEMLLIFPLLGAGIGLHKFLKKKNGSLMAFLPEYLIGSIGSFVWFAAGVVYDQSLADAWSEENIPVISIIAVLLLTGAIFSVGYRIYAKESWNYNFKDYKNMPEQCQCDTGKETKLQVKDLLWIGALTISFSAVVLFKMGSFRVPETYEVLQTEISGGNEIVLEFHQPVELSKIWIYLGYEDKRNFSFSYIEQDEDTWTVFDSNHTIKSCFCWNEVPVNRSMKKLGIVLLEGDAYIHEIVCIDKNGERVLPINAGYYSNLFDEQGLFHQKATYFDQTMFDEVYHARTVYEFLNGLPIYENTHPPLGKTIISIGIGYFGMNPFGWRIMCALCGILMIPVMYLFAHRMFGNTGSAVLATFLLETEFMHFTLSRIATLDIIVGFLILLMFFTMYGFIQSYRIEEKLKRSGIWLFACGVATACAISVKWTGFYAVAGVAVAFFGTLYRQLQDENGILVGIRKHRSSILKLALLCTGCFIVLPLLVYTLSYIPFAKVYWNKSLVQNMLDNAQLMLNYHKDCVFEHPYSSEWYEWLIDKKPLLDSYTVLENEKISTIATFGNPVIVWIGLAALFHQFYLWRCKKCRNAWYLIVAYGAMLLPWWFIHRTLFIYHYFPAIVILIFMIVNSLCHIKNGRMLGVIVAVISMALFVLYYPVLSGVSVDPDYVNQILEWMCTWKFAL